MKLGGRQLEEGQGCLQGKENSLAKAEKHSVPWKSKFSVLAQPRPFVPCQLQPGQARQGHGGRESGGQEAASLGGSLKASGGFVPRAAAFQPRQDGSRPGLLGSLHRGSTLSPQLLTEQDGRC